MTCHCHDAVGGDWGGFSLRLMLWEGTGVVSL